MRASRSTTVGLVVRHGGRWAVRRRYPVWSPTRHLVLALIALLPDRVLGALTIAALERELRRRTQPLTQPAPATALALVALVVGLILGRELLPAPVAERLPV